MSLRNDWQINQKFYKNLFLNDNWQTHSRKKDVGEGRTKKKAKKKKKSIFYGQEAIRNSSCLEFTVESDGG